MELEKLGLILNFTGSIIIWIDAFVLSSYIAPNKITLSGNAGCKIIISKFFLHVGLALLVAGFWIQLRSYNRTHDKPTTEQHSERDK